MSNSNINKYPMSVKLFHSLIALLMIATLVVGWQLEDNEGLMGLHKSLGIAVLLLGVLRLINRIRAKDRIPASVNTIGSLKYWVEKAVHGLLYLTMFGLPVVGWLTSNAFGYPASFFGLFNLPTLIGKNIDLAEQLGSLHGFGADVFVGLLAVHILGALVHLLMNKENVFKRMS
ncbi:cytochrome b [Hydromonas duriensis]|uniref:Cytochrome b561 n=1 Tax=Hydromonas duriensis TaxID=1527608 RepID=A0A4R6YB42_9BURK|nr:cytochrome b [Hydromonas duriensis]TDR32833.1 cytochrome b561 [Hydromonas duriensis]